MKVRIEAESDEATRKQLKAELELHHRKAEGTYQQLREDSALAQSDPNTDTLSFDVEKSLPTPLLTTNVIYYKRQLWMYNLGVHCCSTEVGYMYMWNETIASRGSNEIDSCILTHFREHNTSAENLVLYSDSCGGQNRHIVCLWMHIVSSNLYSYTTIDHKFMLSGHSYLPNDRDFGSIVSQRRRTTAIYVPEDWCKLVGNARRRNPFQVRRMTRTDFVSSASIFAMIVNRKVNVSGEKVEWLKIHWIRVEKSFPFHFKYRYTLNPLEEWKAVELRPKRAGRPTNIGTVELQPLYTAPRPIKSAKLHDLKQLLCYIPPIHHAVYNEITSESDVDTSADRQSAEADVE